MPIPQEFQALQRLQIFSASFDSLTFNREKTDIMILELWRSSCKISLLSVLALCNTLASTLNDSALAQVVPDSTLGNESSVATPNGNVENLLIEGGATRGVNLFHSFQEFNVGEGGSVNFANPQGITDIFSRVTGSNRSNILGNLGVLGNANLFLINPNGIIFGSNANLNVAGSFFATTADSFVFDNGLQFSANNPQAAPLLSVSVTPGLQFGANAGDIRSFANPDPDKANLTIGKDLTLAGQNLYLQRGLRAIEGNINLTAIGDITTADVSSFIGEGGIGNGGNITITSLNGKINTTAGEINSSGFGDESNPGKGGDITINASGDITTAKVGSYIGVRIRDDGTVEGGIGDAGNVTIESRNGKINTSAGEINSAGFGSQNRPGKAGNIILTASGDITTEYVGSYMGDDGIGDGGSVTITSKSGEFSLDGNQIRSFTSSGKGGDIKITAKSVFLDNGANLSAEAFGEAKEGGNIKIEADSVSLDNGSALLAQALGQGKAGSVSVEANQSISLANRSYMSTGSKPSSFIYVGGESSGNNITLEANSIDLSGVSILETNTNSPGDAGDVNINTQNLKITGGSEVLSQTYSSGNAGNVFVNKDLNDNDKDSSSVTISGIAPFAKDEQGNDVILDNNGDPTGGFSSGLFASTENQLDQLGNMTKTATGNAGNITVNTGDLIIENGGAISARSRSNGNAGNIKINVNTLDIRGGGQIVTSTFRGGQAGDINVTATGDINISGIDSDYGKRFEEIKNAFIDQDLTEENADDRTRFTLDTLGGDFAASGFKLLSDPSISESSKDAGNISIYSENGSINFEKRADLSSSIYGNGKPGNITLTANNGKVSLNENAQIVSTIELGANSTSAEPNKISIDAGSLFLNDGAQINTSTFGQGDAGDIFVNANADNGEVKLTNDSIIAAIVGNTANGKGGDINITSNTLFLTDGSQVATLVQKSSGAKETDGGVGNAGNIKINATESVTLSGINSENRSNGRLGFSSGLLTLSERGASGDAGNVDVKTGNFKVDNGAIVTAATFNSGNAQKITIEADNVELTSGGQILTNTRSSGNAGSIKLNVANNITISGTDPNYNAREQLVDQDRQNTGSSDEVRDRIVNYVDEETKFSPSGIFANTDKNSTGKGGDINIDPKLVTIENGGILAANSQGDGIGGNVELTSNRLILNNGKITAETSAADGGDVTLTVPEALVMINNSQIQASAGGDGGTILINEENNRQGILATVRSQDNDIRANAFGINKEGGDIQINTLSVIGFETQNTGVDNNSNLSEINAKSRSGLDGTVLINNPDEDPANSITALPADVVDPSNQIDQGCAAFDEDTASEFRITGRGGLPPSPDQPLNSNTVWEDTRTTATAPQNLRANTTAKTPNAEVNKITPATGWVFKDNGEVTLVASASKATPEQLGSAPKSCPTR